MSINSTYCCSDGSEIFPLDAVTKNTVQIPRGATQVSLASTTMPPSPNSKLRTIKLGVGIGLVLPLTLVLITFISFSLRAHLRRKLHPQAIAIEPQDEHTHVSDFETLELPGHQGVELHTGRRSPTVEMSG